jgi:antitoxin component HigA of HigAB toxin-antitoxin module
VSHPARIEPIPPPEPRQESTGRVRFVLRAGRVTAEKVYSFEDLNLDVESDSADEAKELIREFWDRFGAQMRATEETVRKASGSSDLDLIRERMRELGMNQADLARRSGVHTSHVSAILRGSAGLTPKKRKQIFEALGLTHSHNS